MNRDLVIVVNNRDEETGVMEKIQAHRLGVRHRAFSIFVFNSKGEYLLQQRAKDKYHSPGLWSNTCCSHPMPGETIAQAANRRLFEEMGLICKLEEKFSFLYNTDVGGGLIEHEYDHVFVGFSDDIPNCNTDEVADWRYIPVADLLNEIKAHPDNFTAWFRICLAHYNNKLKDK